MSDYFDWIDILCHRLHHLTQVYMNKHFYYDFELAQNASKHSEYMAKKNILEHSKLLGSLDRENIVCISLRDNDEDTLHDAVRILKGCPCHNSNMKRFDILGIGVAVDTSNNMLYVTQRFR